MSVKLKNCSEKQGIKVTIPWFYDKKQEDQSISNWNDVCVWVMEQYGLPGDRYVMSPRRDAMEFTFADEKDAVHTILRWL